MHVWDFSSWQHLRSVKSDTDTVKSQAKAVSVGGLFRTKPSQRCRLLAALFRHADMFAVCPLSGDKADMRLTGIRGRKRYSRSRSGSGARL
jgi:hypothetical protein